MKTQMMHSVQVTRLTNVITKNEPTRGSCSTWKTIQKVVEFEKDAEDAGSIDDEVEKDVLLRSWISGT